MRPQPLPDSETSLFVDIVIPLYNEERIIAQSTETVLDFLQKNHFPYRYRITLANNASTDASTKICDSLSEKYPKTVRHLLFPWRGKGRAIKQSWLDSNADICVFMDADLASDLNFLPKLIEPIATRKHDLSIGNRLGKKSIIMGRRLYREVISRVYNFFVRLMLRSKLDDHQCGFKAIRRDIFVKLAPQIKDTSWFFDTELITLALKQGYSIHPIDIIWTDSRESKVRLVRTSYELAKAVLELRKRI